MDYMMTKLQTENKRKKIKRKNNLNKLIKIQTHNNNQILKNLQAHNKKINQKKRKENLDLFHTVLTIAIGKRKIDYKMDKKYIL